MCSHIRTHVHVVERQVPSRHLVAAHDNTERHLGGPDFDVPQHDVLHLTLLDRVADGGRNVGPAERARVRVTRIRVVGLLRGSDPDGELIGFVHDDVFERDVDHLARTAAELGVDAFVRVMRDEVPKRNVLRERNEC